MNGNNPLSQLATITLPVRTGLCSECGVLCTSRCTSCGYPLCYACERGGCEAACSWCHFYRGCQDPDCLGWNLHREPLAVLATDRDPLPEEALA